VSDRTVVNSPDAPPAIGPYSQAVKAGGFLFLSGQIPLVGNTGKIVQGMVKEQTEQVIINILGVLAAEKLDLSDVVKATVFLASMNEFSAMNEIYSKYFVSDPPARSTIEVSRLPRDVRVEIEVIARLRT
jgi:2-iminobutanoate/2-iminopropanoate deaminase